MMDTIKFYLYYLDSLFIGYPFIIRVTVSMVILLVFLYGAAMVNIFFIVRRRRRDVRRTNSIIDRYKDNLTSVLVNEKDMEYYEIKDALNPNDVVLKDWEKKFITLLILDIKRNNTTNLNNYKEVFNIFPIMEYWEKKIQKNNVKANKTALRILDEIKEGISGTLFSKKINSNESILRKDLKSKHVKYASNDAFKFLENNFDSDFNALDAIRLHDSLKERNKLRPLPTLTKWLKNAQNESFQIFIIKEIGYFKQITACDFLIDLFKSTQSNLIKIQIAKTLGVLKYEKAVEALSDEFSYSITDVQDSIIEMMGEIGSKDAYAFLQNAYPSTQNNETVIKIIKNMYKINKLKTSNFIKKADPSAFEQDTLNYIKHKTTTV